MMQINRRSLLFVGVLFRRGVVVVLFARYAETIVEGGAVGGLHHSFLERVNRNGIGTLIIVGLS
jgi:hypothetical protein